MNYTEKELVAFGEYLLSKERAKSLKRTESSISYKERKRFVYDADITNFKHLNNINNG